MKSEFFEAVAKGDAEAVRRFLAAEPGLLSARKDSGESALLTALYNRRQEVAELLLARNPELDIFEASAAGRCERVHALLAADGAAVHSYSFDGWTALHLAAFFGHRDVADLLLPRGADVKAVSRNPSRNMPLHAAMPLDHLAVAELLIAEGADVNARQAGGFTPLHAAASNGNVEMVRLLVGSGADVTAQSDDGRTALAFAREKGHQQVIELLSRAAPANKAPVR